MIFVPYVLSPQQEPVSVRIVKMRKTDALKTIKEPKWQSDWTSEYIAQADCDKYAVKTADNELIALGMYEILSNALVVRIVYMEAQPESNPTIAGVERKYYGIGKLLIAFGIKLSIDNGFGGDVILEAKTDALAKHYRDDFGGVELPRFNDSAPRFLIQDENAKEIFFTYLK